MWSCPCLWCRTKGIKKRHHKRLARTRSLNYQYFIENSERAASRTVDPTGQLLPALSWLSIRASLTVFAYFPIKSKAHEERKLFIKQIVETRTDRTAGDGKSVARGWPERPSVNWNILQLTELRRLWWRWGMLRLTQMSGWGTGAWSGHGQGRRQKLSFVLSYLMQPKLGSNNIVLRICQCSVLHTY